MTYYLHKVYVIIQLLLTAESEQDPDPHWVGSLDPDPHGDRKLYPDPH